MRFLALAVLALGMASPMQAPPPAQAGPTSIAVLRDGKPVSALDIVLVAADGPKPLGQTGPQGILDIVLAAGNKPKSVQVVLVRCPDGKERLLLVEQGIPFSEKDCDSQVLAIFQWDKARTVTVDLGLKTVSTGQSGLSGKRLAIGGGALGAVLLGVAAIGGDSSNATPTVAAPPSPVVAPTPAPTPTPAGPVNVGGSYRVTVTLASDPSGQAPSLALPSSIDLVFTVSGSSLTITCPPGARWIPTNGLVDVSTGRFTSFATGPLAGGTRAARLDGTVDRNGQLVGTTYTVESGSAATIYTATGGKI